MTRASADATARRSADVPVGRGARISRVRDHRVAVCFGGCDAAGIDFFSNLSNFPKWMDTASLSFSTACGVPPWREMVATRGIIGTPLQF